MDNSITSFLHQPLYFTNDDEIASSSRSDFEDVVSHYWLEEAVLLNHFGMRMLLYSNNIANLRGRCCELSGER